MIPNNEVRDVVKAQNILNVRPSAQLRKGEVGTGVGTQHLFPPFARDFGIPSKPGYVRHFVALY